MSDFGEVHFSPIELLQCPVCGAGVTRPQEQETEGLNPKTLFCSGCETQHFTLAGIPCLFPAGLQHKTIWQHQAAHIQAQGQMGLEHIQESAARYDLSLQTRERLVGHFSALAQSLTTTMHLLAESGIQPIAEPALGDGDPGDFSEYYDLILRDWAWKGSENTEALARVLEVLPQDCKPKRILVLGAGAARLSWDLHCALAPECTVALDSNPLLLIVADTLIRRRQSIELAERKVFPQINTDVTKTWTIQPPADPNNLRARWFALGANAWRTPLVSESFDLVVTPWFIDANGGDVRDTIALVGRLLTPVGRWVNTGPLLFTRHLPLMQKYFAPEIKEFMAMSGFTLEVESVAEADHLDSPLEVRKQHEQLWTFCARAPQSLPAYEFTLGQQQPWLIMHHLPVPKYPYGAVEQHPLIDAILMLVDGKRSINDMAEHIAPYIPQGISPKDAVVALLGEIVMGMDNANQS